MLGKDAEAPREGRDIHLPHIDIVVIDLALGGKGEGHGCIRVCPGAGTGHMAR